MVDFDNPLEQEFLDELYQGKRETWGDDLTRPRQFVIGRLNSDGSVDTEVTKGEFGRVWVREPGVDTGDAVQAINTVLQPHEVSFNRPVMVKTVSGQFIITDKAPESANYDAQLPVRPQRAINREQYNVALITPSQPDTSFYAYYRGGIFQLNHIARPITDIPSSDFSGTVPGSGTLSVKVELDPVTGTWHETTGGVFLQPSLRAALKNGDLDATNTLGRYLIGWIRLYDGQSAIELEDILPAEHMLDSISDYVSLFPDSDTRNIMQPTGNFRSLGAKSSDGTLLWYFNENGDFITDANETTNTVLGDNTGRGGSLNTYIGDSAGSDGSGFQNTCVGWEAGTAITTGRDNVAVGVDTMWQNETGQRNTGVGFEAFDDMISGDDNVAVGDSCQNSNISGDKNTAIGANAGFLNQSGNGNIFLGYDAGGTKTNVSNELYIHNSRTNDPLIYGNFDTFDVKLNARVHLNPLGIGAFDLQWSSDTESHMFFGDASTEQIFMGGTLNAIRIDKGGELTMLGEATVWDDLRIPGLSVALGASAPDLAAWLAAGNLRVLRFNGNATSEQVFFTVQMPHGYKEGSDIIPHVHWGPVNGDAGNVRWNLEYSWTNFDTVFPNGTIIAVVDAADGTAWKNQVADFPPISGSGKTLSSMLVCRLFRDPTDGDDTYGSDAGFLEFDFHFQSDTIGSKEPFVK